MKPFLKWAGGKSRLADTIGDILPASSRLVEPFLGSGAVFMGVPRDGYLLADVNRDLVELYRALEAGGADFIQRCKVYFSADNNTVERFMEHRARFNSLQIGDLERCALFVYINRHCFNGLCRYNASGNFNVPFGRNPGPHFPAVQMLNFHDRLRSTGALVECQDFLATMDMARAGDVVYCDPPYHPLSATASFGAYAKGGFGQDDQRALATKCEHLARAGIACVVSNHDTEFTRAIYKNTPYVVSHDVRRSISGDGGKRSKAAELFVVYLPQGMAVPARLQAMIDAQGQPPAQGQLDLLAA